MSKGRKKKEKEAFGWASVHFPIWAQKTAKKRRRRITTRNYELPSRYSETYRSKSKKRRMELPGGWPVHTNFGYCRQSDRADPYLDEAHLHSRAPFAVRDGVFVLRTWRFYSRRPKTGKRAPCQCRIYNPTIFTQFHVLLVAQFGAPCSLTATTV